MDWLNVQIKYSPDTGTLQDVANFINPGDGQNLRITEGATTADGRDVYGAAHEGSNTMFVDIADDRLNSLVNTVAHEGMHLNGTGETNATVTGVLTDFAYRVNAWANNDQISGQRVQPDSPLLGIQDQAAHQKLLQDNNSLFRELDDRGELDYRYLSTEERDLAVQLSVQSGGQLTPGDIMDTMRNSKPMGAEPEGFYGAMVDTTQASPENLATLDPSNGNILVTTDAEGNARYLVQNMSEMPMSEAAKSLLEEQGYSFYEKAPGDYYVLAPRDPATGKELDETGRYYVPMIVGNQVFQVPYYPCPTGQTCNGANRDQSSPAAQAWDRAFAADKFDDLSNAATTISIAHPVGLGARAVSGAAAGASMTSSAYDGSLIRGVLNEGSSRVFGGALVDAFGRTAGARVNNVFSLFGVNEMARDIPKDKEVINQIKDYLND